MAENTTDDYNVAVIPTTANSLASVNYSGNICQVRSEFKISYRASIKQRVTVEHSLDIRCTSLFFIYFLFYSFVSESSPNI